MLRLTIKDAECFDDSKNEFLEVKGQTLELEHSLVSLAKWESKWLKPFLNLKEIKSFEETVDYIKCMTITQNVSPDVYKIITQANIDSVNEYISAPMTATTFKKNEPRTIYREIITAEIIYYWMVFFNIPFECQKWHLNRLLTLINVCNIKNQPSKKMSKRELLARNRELNAARKAELNTTG